MRPTPDQIRLTLERITETANSRHCGCGNVADDTRRAVLAIVDLLRAVLPDLVAAAQKKDDTGSRYAGLGSQERESSRFGWCHPCQVFARDERHFGTPEHIARLESISR